MQLFRSKIGGFTPKVKPAATVGWNGAGSLPSTGAAATQAPSIGTAMPGIGMPTGAVGPPLMAPTRMGNGGRRDEFRNVPGRQPATPFGGNLLGAGRGGGNAGGMGGGGNRGGRGNYLHQFFGGGGAAAGAGGGGQVGSTLPDGSLPTNLSYGPDANYRAQYRVDIPTNNPISDQLAAQARADSQAVRNPFEMMGQSMPWHTEANLGSRAWGAGMNQGSQLARERGERNLANLNFQLSTAPIEEMLRRFIMGSEVNVQNASLLNRLQNQDDQYPIAQNALNSLMTSFLF